MFYKHKKYLQHNPGKKMLFMRVCYINISGDSWLGLVWFAQNCSLISAFLLYYSVKETFNILFQQTLKYLSDKEKEPQRDKIIVGKKK